MIEALTGEVEVVLLRPGARPPTRTRPGDAGFDISCAEGFELAPGEAKRIATGFSLALPAGIVGLVCPRSGLAARHRVTVVNGPGVVDGNFRGECCVLLINLGSDTFAAAAGDRIAQLVLVPYHAPAMTVVDALPEAPDDRGTGGFGSSGR